ncbi:unnamed protein product [Phytophthora fragariaefolia]|uniref:Unnamed protein product n=1 Tax=Phytophthora fragariaefolia TaxID=1490495 RepID=A0A9W7CZF3_9STRA|nr:unnamed protein product [Phytophthora fragariaefolia]
MPRLADCEWRSFGTTKGKTEANVRTRVAGANPKRAAGKGGGKKRKRRDSEEEVEDEQAEDEEEHAGEDDAEGEGPSCSSSENSPREDGDIYTTC